MEKNKLVSKLPKMDLISNLFTKKTELIESDGYNIGEMNESGVWNGLLGYIQRGETDSCFHPIPLVSRALHCFWL